MNMSSYFDNKELSFMAPKITELGRHMVMTNVQPEIKTKYVNVDTRFQEEFNLRSSADVIIQLPQSIRDVKCLKITNIEIPFSFYPFSVTQKNTFMKITSSANNISPKIILIKDNNYTENSIINTIQYEISLLSDLSGLTISYDSVNKKVIFTNISNTVYYTIDFAVDEIGNYDKYDLKSKLGWCLGFREPQYTIQNRTSIQSESILNVYTSRYIYVSVDDFQSNSPNSFIVPSTKSYLNSNVLSRVSLDPYFHSFGSVIVTSEMDGKLLSDTRTYSGKNDIQKLRIQLLNEYGQVLNLNKMDFSFALMIQYV